MSHPENKELIPPSLIYLSDNIKEKPQKGETLFKAVSVTDQDEYPTITDIFDLRLREIIKELFEGVDESYCEERSCSIDENLYGSTRAELERKRSEAEPESRLRRWYGNIMFSLDEDEEELYPEKSADDRFEEESKRYKTFERE